MAAFPALVACSGFVAPAAGPPPAQVASERAEAIVGAATRAGSDAGETALRVLVDGRIADANALVDALVAALRATRLAVPSTRAVDPVLIGEAETAIATARIHVDARAAEPVWSGRVHNRVIDGARQILGEVDALLGACGDQRYAEADVLYGRVFERYEAFRADAAALAARSELDPLATWAGPAEPAGAVVVRAESATVENTVGGAPAEGAGTSVDLAERDR